MADLMERYLRRRDLRKQLVKIGFWGWVIVGVLNFILFNARIAPGRYVSIFFGLFPLLLLIAIPVWLTERRLRKQLEAQGIEPPK